jgi:O-antigen/teichoic acid export membrane protein
LPPNCVNTMSEWALNIVSKLQVMIVDLLMRIPWFASMANDRSSLLSRSVRYLRGVNEGPEADGMVKDASVTLLLKIIGMCLGLVYNITLAKVLGVEGVGAYYLILSVTSIGLIVSQLGLDNVLVRNVAAALSGDDWKTVESVYRSGLLIALLSSLTVSAAIIIASPLIMREAFNEPGLVTPLRIMAISIIPNALYNLHGELFRGVKRFPYATFIQNICIHLINIPIVLLLARSFGIVGVLTSYAFSSVLVLSVGRYLWVKTLPERKKDGGRVLFPPRQLVQSSIPLLWMMLAITVSNSIDSFIIKSFVDIGAVGIYGVTKRISVLIGFFLASMNYVNAPRFSALYAKNKIAELRALARNSAFISVLITLGPIAICLLFPKPLLSVFGSEFMEGAFVLQLLVIAQFVNVSTGSVGNLLMMSSHEKLTRNNVIIASLIRLIIMYALIRTHGVVGAAVAYIAASVIQNVLMSIQVYRKLSFVVLPIPTRNVNVNN